MLSPQIIIRQAYVRIGAWNGDPAAITTQYSADSSFAQVVSESFPPQAMRDRLTAVENEMCVAIALNPENVLRDIIGDTITATSGSLVSGTSDGGKPVIGEWGQVRNADNGKPSTPGMHEDEILAITDTPTLFKSTMRSHAVRSPRIYATFPNIKIDCCVFDYAARASAILANAPLLFEQSADAYFYGLMAGLKNEDPNYTALSNEYMPLYEAWLMAQRPQTNLTEQAAA